MDGAHLSLFILTPPVAGQGGSLSQGNRLLTQCLKSFLKVHQTCQPGLTSSYIAVVAGKISDEGHQSLKCPGFGTWRRLPPPAHSTLSCSPLYKGHMPPPFVLEDVLSLVRQQSWGGCHGNGCESVLDELSVAIHSLLDNLPPAVNRDDSYYVMDVYWLAPQLKQLLPPESEVDFFGALLRLEKWNLAHIHMITHPSPHLSTFPVVCAWREGVSGLRACSVREWEPPSGVMWRGAIHCTEYKVLKQASHRTLSFPGFSLRLLPLEATPTPLVSPETSSSLDEILEGVGLKTNTPFHPSHLEVLQIVNMATFPLFWLSPLQCKLVLSDTSFSTSEHLIPTLMPSNSNVGVIMCLCTQSHDCQLIKSKDIPRHKEGVETAPGETSCPIRNKTTEEWVGFVQGLEGEALLEELKEEAPSPLLAYATGPRLLVTPTHSATSDKDTLYDAWFLWKPEVINIEVIAGTSQQYAEIADDTEGDSFFSGSLASDLMKELDERESSLVTELSISPSEWQEMKVLKTYEWIQRKMVRRVATADLMFGHMVAPPPRNVTSQLESLNIADVLSSFTNRGLPIASELSPIAMTGTSRLNKVYVPDPGVSYESIIASTPSSKKQYHGVNYCLTDEDSSIDAKLTKIQQRYLFSERASHCSSVVTPKAERAKQQARRSREQSVSLNPPKEQVSKDGAGATPTESVKKVATPQKVTRHFLQNRVGLTLTKNPMIKLSKPQLLKQPPSVKRPPKHAKPPTAPSAVDEQGLNTDASLPHASGSNGNQQNKGVVMQAGLVKKGQDEEKVDDKVRRSPRKNKWKARSDKDGKKETLKSKLSTQVVQALKKEEMPRSNPCFRKCFDRLFKVSKSYLMDLGGAAAQVEEIRRVVELNAKNVVKFEQERHKRAACTSTAQSDTQPDTTRQPHRPQS